MMYLKTTIYTTSKVWWRYKGTDNIKTFTKKYVEDVTVCSLLCRLIFHVYTCAKCLMLFASLIVCRMRIRLQVQGLVLEEGVA